MFKFTNPDFQFRARFIIQHTVCGDHDLSDTYFCVNEAIAHEAKDANCSKEEIALTIREYTPEEVIDAANDGYGWPIKLNLVEEVEEEEDLEVSGSFFDRK